MRPGTGASQAREGACLERLPAHGSSMFPFVPAGSTLVLRPRVAGDVRPGDIVCYPGMRGQVIAHRALGCDAARSASAGERVWIARADATGAEERVGESAIAWIVELVEHRALSYRTDGVLGRLFARIAVRRGLAYRMATSVARAAQWVRAV